MSDKKEAEELRLESSLWTALNTLAEFKRENRGYPSLEEAIADIIGGFMLALSDRDREDKEASRRFIGSMRETIEWWVSEQTSNAN